MLITILVLSLQSIAQGDLLITPKRVVFDGNKQKEELSLVNIGKDTTIFSISFVQYNMQEDGTFITIDKTDSMQMFAEPYLRIFPRKVTLAPGEPQVIMMQCRRKADMKAGEYRSHLFFRSEKNYNPLGMEKSDKDTTLLSVQLIPVYGLSIPIIIRTGELNVSSILSDLKLETQQDTVPYLKLTINRKGNISVYGNIIVEFIPAHGTPYEIGLVKGVGVYTNINKRNISIRLKKIPGMTLKTWKLRAKFISNDETKSEVYAERDIEITN